MVVSISYLHMYCVTQPPLRTHNNLTNKKIIKIVTVEAMFQNRQNNTKLSHYKRVQLKSKTRELTTELGKRYTYPPLTLNYSFEDSRTA